jgi:hypothetical protein
VIWNTDRQPIQIRQCTSFREVAAMIANDTLGIADFFKCLYNGFADASIVWFAYHDDNHNFENPVKLRLDNCKDDEYATNSLREAITPRILPANFTLGRGQPSYEFYYQSVAARQLGFVQIAIHLFFADKVQARDIVKSALFYNRLKNLEPNAAAIDLGNW